MVYSDRDLILSLLFVWFTAILSTMATRRSKRVEVEAKARQQVLIHLNINVECIFHFSLSTSGLLSFVYSKNLYLYWRVGKCF